MVNSDDTTNMPTLYEALRDNLTAEQRRVYAERHAHPADADTLTDWLTAYINDNEVLKAIHQNDTDSDAYAQAVSVSTIYDNEPEVLIGQMTALDYYQQTIKRRIVTTQVEYGDELKRIYEDIREHDPSLPSFDAITVGYSVS